MGQARVRWHVAGLALALLSAVASASGPSGIVGGTATTGFPAVGALLNEDGQFYCSAFLIGPSCVLTAAHCVTPTAPPPGPSVFFGSVVGEAALARINVREYQVHPSYNEMNVPAHDVAVIGLWSATDIVPPGSGSA